MLKKLMLTTDSWGLLGLRLVTGAIFIAHGLPKFGFMGGGGLEGLASWLGGMGVPLPMLNAILVASSETIGGAMLIVGFMTRFAGALVGRFYSQRWLSMGLIDGGSGLRFDDGWGRPVLR